MLTYRFNGLTADDRTGNDQSYLDGQERPVWVLMFGPWGDVEARTCIGTATTWTDAQALATARGYFIAPAGDGFDCGHVAAPGDAAELDGFGVPVILPVE